MFKLFTQLSKDEKINFFLKIQELLIKHHPKSGFIIRENNVNTFVDSLINWYFNYKGYCVNEDNFCLLFNKILIEKTEFSQLKNVLFNPPNKNANCLFIDFVVSKKIKSCLEFFKSQVTINLKWVIYIRNNKINQYDVQKLSAFLSQSL
jgi:hypothetical protein